MNSEQDKERYLIEGNLPVGLLKFAAPFMLAYLLQALYGAVDLMIIGQFCDAGAVSAVGIGAQLLHLLLGVLFGLSVGGTVLIGYNLGAKDPEGTANAIGSTATLFAIIALAVAPIAALSTERCVRAMQTPPEAFEYACQYVFICACGIPFIVGYNVVGAIYRGLGDSFTPTIFVAVACAFNVVGDLILIGDFNVPVFGTSVHVGGFNLGPAGAAYATVAAQGLSFLLALAYMRRKRFSFEFHRTNFILRRKSVVEILKVGVPLSFQDVLTGLSFLVILAIVNLMGVQESAGLAVAERVIGFLLLPPIAFSAAVSTAAAQNLGARKNGRAFRAFLYGTCYSLAAGLIFWGLCQVCPTAISGLFAHETSVAEQSARYLRSFSLDCIMVAFIFNINGYFCGASRSMIVSAHSIFAAVCVRIPISYAFSRIDGATLWHVGFAAPLATLASILICVFYFLWLRRTGRLSLEDGEAPPDPAAPEQAAA